VKWELVLLEKAFQRFCRILDAVCSKCAFVLLPASYLLAGARSRGGRKVKAGLHLV
jgi:hypothetical protein